MYKGTMDLYKKTIAKDGVRGLWLGWTPNVIRNGLVNCAEVATYDQTKQWALGYGFKDGSLTYCMCAIAGSFNAAVIGCPPDVIKTRTMNNRTAATKVGYLTLANQIY